MKFYNILSVCVSLCEAIGHSNIFFFTSIEIYKNNKKKKLNVKINGTFKGNYLYLFIKPYFFVFGKEIAFIN